MSVEVKPRTENVGSGWNPGQKMSVVDETQDRKYILMMEQNDEFMRNISV